MAIPPQGPASDTQASRRPAPIVRAYLAFERRLDVVLIAIGRAISRIGRSRPGRFLVSLGSGGASLLAAGLVGLLVLAQPAFRETRGDWLKPLDLAVTFLDRHDAEIGRRGIRHHDGAEAAALPAVLVGAVLATEDRRFFRHPGIDPLGLARAMVANAHAGGIVQGGSTLTQQLAKNVFLSNERSLERKITEGFLALWLEAQLGKAEILRLYADRVYLGEGTFGLPAAAEVYFGKPVREVSLAEAAMLAGMLKAPSRYAPHAHLADAQARAGRVLDGMVAAGFVSAGEAGAARIAPAVPVERPPATAADFYLDWAFGEIGKLAASGRLGSASVLTAATPLDRAIQRRAESTLAGLLAREGPRYGVGQAAMVVMDPDGAVRAMVGGRDYQQSGFNRASEAKRQPGSAFKPFVYAAALVSGAYAPDSVVVDSEVCLDGWCPHNYAHSYAGSVPLWLALATSINTIPIKLSIGIGAAMDAVGTLGQADVGAGPLAKRGRERIVDLAHRMGLTTALPDSASLPLGAAEVSLLDLTSAYAVFANGGARAAPYGIWEIRDAGEALVYARAEPQSRVLAPRIVASMNAMLVKVPEQGTGRRAALPGLRSAGKTGTTNDYRDAWYVGFTGDLVAGIWFGNDDHSPTRQMTGGTLPAMAWREVMSFAHRDLVPKPIPGLGADRPGADPVAPGGFAEVRVASGRGFAEIGGVRDRFREP